MEPFLALGEEMKAKGDEVGFCFPAQFEQLALDVSPNFFPQSKFFLDLFNSREVRKILGRVGNLFTRLIALKSLTKKINPIQYQLILDQEKAVQTFKPDLVVFHIKCIYPFIWAMSQQGKIQLLSPMPCILHTTYDQPHIGFGKPGPTWWNKMTYHLALYATINKSILGYGKKFLQERNINVNKDRLIDYLRNELPVEYAYDELLFPRPSYWPSHVVVSKFRERNKVKQYVAPKELLSFLSNYPNPLYIGFGSMVNNQPEKIGADILTVCSKKNIPVIINSSWGGIKLPEQLPDWAFQVSDVPFDFLFEKVSMVIHHGGSGTTHSSLRCKKPQAIIPHLGDQFFWNRQIEKSKVGVAGFPIDKWSLENFEILLDKLLSLTSSLYK